MDFAFGIGLVFGTLLGVVLGLAGSYAMSRQLGPFPGERSLLLLCQSEDPTWHIWHRTLD